MKTPMGCMPQLHFPYVSILAIPCACDVSYEDDLFSSPAPLSEWPPTVVVYGEELFSGSSYVGGKLNR
jgi:hypothetical protein